MEKKENRFLVLAKRMSRNTNAMIGLAIFCGACAVYHHCTLGITL